MSKSSPLIVITGPTASGKTGLAIELAERYGGEIICADSRTIYRGMDIGTAKPTLSEQARVPHHLINVVNPDDRYTAADFQRDAYAVIEDIRARQKIPFLVGGTGLYIDAVVREYTWPRRAIDNGSLLLKSIDELQLMIKEQQKSLPVNSRNKRHLINVLMREDGGSALPKPADSTFVVGIATKKELLHERIMLRAQEMFAHGVVDETRKLGEVYGWGSEAMTSNIYPIVRRMIQGEITEQAAIELFAARDRQLAKRQLTWLRRHDYVRWLSLDDARVYIETILG